MRVLIVGCGYVGRAVGEELAGSGHQVTGLRRSAGPREGTGINWVQGDITQNLGGVEGDWDWVLNTVSSSRGGVEEYRNAYLTGTRNLLARLRENPPGRYLHTSSTSVYGQIDGSIITEESPTEPVSETSKVLIEAEQEVRNAASWLNATIMRVAGIYGPGRGHLLNRFAGGEGTLIGNGDHYINMVHVSDLVRIIIHLFHQPEAGELLNVVDNEPVKQKELYMFFARQLQKPMPLSSALEPPRKRAFTNKRISNDRLRRTGYSFVYPTFREGYESEIRRLRTVAI